MLWCHFWVLILLFQGADFFPIMRMKINLLAKTNMGSTNTLRPNQRHQQVAWACSTTSVSLFWPNKPYKDFVKNTFALNAFGSGELRHSSGELWQSSCGAPPSWILGRNGFLWSCKVKSHILGAFGAVSKSCQSSPELAQIAHSSSSK